MDNTNNPIKVWNAYGQRQRTNSVEGRNSKLNAITGRNQPNVKFLTQIWEDCESVREGVCGRVNDPMTDVRLGFLFTPVATGGGETLQKGKERIPLDAFGGIRRQKRAQ
ncbi:hypothetical protein TNCV_2693791 [Trichonephila clavipes]|nr:hypothetical protein TNCV_2693791 [Trichonephila clavipes]